MRVLISDDEIIVRKKLRRILEEEFFEVVGEAKNGYQLLTKYKELNPDIVIIKIGMPFLDVLTILNNIIDYNKESCVIMLSEDKKKKEIFESLLNGAKHYILKPLVKENVIKVINEVITMDKNL